MFSRTAPALLTLVALATVAGAAPRDPQYKDQVNLVGGKSPTRDIEIVTETWEKVEWKNKNGATQSRPAAEVASVVYGDTPPHFTHGMEAWSAGRYGEAVSSFSDALLAVQQDTARPWCSSRSKAYIGDSKRRLAERAKNPAAEYVAAITVFQESYREEPKSPILDLVLTGLARSQAGAGQFDAASKSLDELVAASRAAQRPLWEARARLTRGTILQKKGDLGAAAQEFADLAGFCQSAAATQPADSPARAELSGMRVNGLVRQAWAAYARAESSKSDGDISAARALFDRLGSDTGGEAAGRVAAINGRGALAMLKGDAKAALAAFIEVEVTGFAVPEEVARALWYKAKAYDALGDARGKEAALKDLADFYPWSEWADRAR